MTEAPEAAPRGDGHFPGCARLPPGASRGLRHRLRIPLAELGEFNWALDWFDVLAAEIGDRPALRIVEEDGSEETLSFAELSERSSQVANWCASGVCGAGIA